VKYSPLAAPHEKGPEVNIGGHGCQQQTADFSVQNDWKLLLRAAM